MKLKPTPVFFILFALCSPLFAAGRHPAPVEDKQQPIIPASFATEKIEEVRPLPQMEEPQSLAVFLVAHPEGNPEKIIAVLSNHPELKLTLIFPARYFDTEPRRASISGFSLLQSSQQIEVALSLENEPVLPLLADLKMAGGQILKWGFNFSWPEDVAAQIARASGKYQKRWGLLPSGFYPPFLALSEKVVDISRKFRLNWVLARPDENWGVKFYGGTALLVAPKPPVLEELKLGSQAWADQMVHWTMTQPYVLIDTSQWENPSSDAVYLETLAKVWGKAETRHPLVTGTFFTDNLKHEYALSDTSNPFYTDYSGWVSTPQQKRAWAALSDARQVINTYQESGRANLQRLDAAVEEMCSAESGQFLLVVGQSAAAASFNERNFLATLGNIYRLCQTPVPPNLNTWFATRTWQKTVAKTPENDRPFFVEGPQSLTWNDPKGDDNGSGKYTYPFGPYAKGVFDLRELTVSWTESDVTVSASVVEPFADKPTNVVPLIDVYVDVNKLPNAGSTKPLRKRGESLIMPEAAWEFALALSPAATVLYQAVPGGMPRVIEMKNGETQTNLMTATFSRKLLRGDPRRWRLSAGLMGTENSQRLEEPVPAEISINAGEKNFGGAATNHQTPYIDLLSPTTDDQAERIGANETGGPLNMPYVEAQ